MSRFRVVLLACLAPAVAPGPALAGAQYTAEDVIRYFGQANATAAAPGPSVARTAPASDRGIVIGDPAAQPATPQTAAPLPGAAPAAAAPAQGVVIGNAPPAAVAPAAAPPVVTGGAAPGAPAGTEAPLVIPLTGAKAGYAVPPVTAAAVASTATGQAQGRTGTGYDLLVTFELDSAKLTEQARQNLDAFARALTSPALSALRFAVEGHTDATGSAEHNLELSERRAASVVAYLVEHGVAADRLTGAGFGETRPRIADPEHPDNRRVETRRLN